MSRIKKHGQRMWSGAAVLAAAGVCMATTAQARLLIFGLKEASLSAQAAPMAQK